MYLPTNSLEQNVAHLVNEGMDNSTKIVADAFDGSAEPIIYMSDNRMPVMVEFTSSIIYIIFAAFVLALLFILPGVRRTKLTSFLGIVTLLTVGATILLAIDGSHWLIGSVQVHDAPYSALTSKTISGRLEVHVGLTSVNVTLLGQLSKGSTRDFNNNLVDNNVDYNERFHWDLPERMAKEHIEALRRGLPYPILTVTEFLSQDSDGFNWSRQLRQAGFYSSLALYVSLVSWCLMALVMCTLPVYLPHMMQITGALMMTSVSIYTILIQSPKIFSFQVGGNPVEFAFGFTYLSTFMIGAISMFAGVLLFVLQMNNPHERFTIMDSEQYVNDHKAQQQGSSLTKEAIKAKFNLFGINNHLEKGDHKKSDNVIIPISDIEQNFKPANPTQ